MSHEEFIKKVEANHFRTCDDMGGNAFVMMIWNQVRNHFGMLQLRREDLPAYCITHNLYHKICLGYGCKRG